MKKNYFLGIIMIPALMLVSAMAYGQYQAVAIYKFDETSGTVAADASGSGYDGTVNCDTCWGEGTIDGGLNLYGEQFVTLPAADMGMTSTLGSVALWVKIPEGDAESIYTLWSGGDNETGGGFGPENEMHLMVEKPEPDIWVGGEFGYFAVTASGNLHIFSDPEKGPSAGVPPVDPITVNDDTWHHIVCTWGKGVTKLYFDGAPIWDTTIYTPAGYDLSVMKIGSMLSGGRATVGTLDDVRIYGDVLDDNKVSDLYNGITYVDHVLADEIDLSIFPNPATSETTVGFYTEAGSDISVNLYSLTGSLIGNVHNGISVAGKNLVQIPTANYGPGIYFVELQINNDVTYTKLVIQ